MVCRYRDNVEFYRHIPAELPATTVLPAPHCTGLQSPPQVFVMPGLDVLDYSTPSHIVLNSVASHTSGDFRCEVTTHSTDCCTTAKVSAGPPRFSTASRSTQLQVVGECEPARHCPALYCRPAHHPAPHIRAASGLQSGRHAQPHLRGTLHLE